MSDAMNDAMSDAGAIEGGCRCGAVRYRAGAAQNIGVAVAPETTITR